MPSTTTESGSAGEGAGSPQSLVPEITIHSMSDEEMVFEMRGTTPAMANTLRRALGECVPTMAISEVKVVTNTTCMQDEMWSSRLGLIPLKINPSLFEFRQREDWRTDGSCTVKFKYSVQGPPEGEPPQYVYSKSLEWVPLDQQQGKFRKTDLPRPVKDDILLCKLAPGDVFEAECYAVKGSGKTHTRFSPTCPTSYKMTPKVEFRDAYGEETRVEGAGAEELKSLCPGGVFDIEDGAAIVRNQSACTMCRECVREKFATQIKLSRDDSRFIFTVESTGVYTAREVVREGLLWVKYRSQDLRQHVWRSLEGEGGAMDMD